MQASKILDLLGMLYINMIRSMLLELVKKTDNDYDDLIVDILDRIFQYSP